MKVNKITSKGVSTQIQNVKKKSKLFHICTWSLIGILVVCQIKFALYQTKNDFGNMTDVQKGIAQTVLSQQEYDKLASAETDALESKFLKPITVSRGDITRPTVAPIQNTPTSITPTATTISEIPDAGTSNTEIMSTGTLKVPNKVIEAVVKTSNMVGLDVKLGKTLVHTESGYDPKSVCSNSGYKDRNGVWHEGSTDYGLTQVNNRGGVIGDWLGEKVDLADGRKQVQVTESNYKTDMYVNLAIGLASYKRYLNDLCDNNPFIAYSCYNAGEGTASVFRSNDKSELSLNSVCDILTDTGKPAFIQASRNTKNNFGMKYNLYFK